MYVLSMQVMNMFNKLYISHIWFKKHGCMYNWVKDDTKSLADWSSWWELSIIISYCKSLKCSREASRFQQGESNWPWFCHCLPSWKLLWCWLCVHIRYGKPHSLNTVTIHKVWLCMSRYHPDEDNGMVVKSVGKNCWHSVSLCLVYKNKYYHNKH